MSVGTVLIVVAVVCFVLVALGVGIAHVPLLPVGFAFFAAGHLPWPG